MNQKILKLVGWAALLLIVASLCAYFCGKYRTSYYSFEFGVSAFLIFFCLSLFLYFSKSIPKFLGFFLLISFSILTLFSAHFLDEIREGKRKNYREWTLKAKQKGLILELPFTKRQKESEEKYNQTLIQNNLDQVKQGYTVSEIFPKFTQLDGAYFTQLDFIGVRYVVFHIKEGKQKIFLNVTNLPVVATYPKQILFKVPIRKPKITVLYGSEFSDALRLDFGKGSKWFAQEQGHLYLHNHEYRDWLVALKLKLVSKNPVSVKIRHQNRDEIVWQGEVKGEALVELPQLSLLSGKNLFLFEVGQSKTKQEPIDLLLSEGSGVGLGLADLDVHSLGLKPEAILTEKNKVTQADPAFEKWMDSLNEETTYLQYPLAHKDWSTPIRYKRNRGEHNFYYDQSIPKFAARFLGNKPTASLALWMDFLGIDYLVLHTELYNWPPLLKEGDGFELLNQFGSVRIYKPATDQIYFESEKAPRQKGSNVVDSDTREGMARVSVAQAEGRSGYLVFGPHVPLSPGKYRVTYKLRAETKSDQLLAKIDVCAREGNKVLVEKELKGSDFNQAAQYQEFLLEFELDQVEKVEFRVWHEDVKNGLWSDTILLERVN